jgi:hypothetical protein
MPRLDPRALRPAELARLLNSTPLGEVVQSHTIYRQRNRAGYRIGDGQTIDLVRYVAWLARERHAPRPPKAEPSYDQMKERARERNARLSAEGRDIAPLPAVADPDRKARASGSFRAFCETYFPQTFHLPWSPDHLKVVARIEQAVLHGGLFARAMPRGSGKTSLCERACIWAILTGARRFVCLIGSDEGHAVNMLDTIKTELESNDLLLEDFPEAVHPIRCLEGIANRCAGQLYEGRRTFIEWTAKELVLPTIPGSAASGAILKVAGITGRIRGMKHQTAGGESIRPDLVILDDPQTDESARSLSQCQARESILAGAVLGLAGPGKRISGIMPCTVIKPGDMADRIVWFSQNMWRDYVAAYLGVDLLNNVERYWDYQATTGDNWGGCLYYDTTEQNNLNFYPRGATVFGMPLSAAGLSLNRVEKELILKPLRPTLSVPLLPLADWAAMRIPVLTVEHREGVAVARVSERDLLDGLSVHVLGVELEPA